MGFNIFPSLVVDILHEFDLGIFKSVLKHLLRTLHAVDPSHIHVVNDRYVLSHLYEHTTALHLSRFKAVPSFGLQSICPFPDNVTDLSHRPAWFFEDILQVWHTLPSSISNPMSKQCAMPVFDGLLPPKHNELVQTLLFRSG